MAYISRYVIFVGSNVKRCLLPLVFQKHVTLVVLVFYMGIAFRVQDLSRIYLDRSFRLADQNISFQLHRLLVHSQHLSFQHELIRNVIS